MAIGMRRASGADLDDVLGVLDEAAAWLQARGVGQWPARFERPWIERAVQDGRTWLAVDGLTVVGTLTLDGEDELWVDRPGPATFVHRLAVRRSSAGIGVRLLAWATTTARVQGDRYPRLDCVATNRRLRRYYVDAGFRHCGDAVVGGPPGGRAGDGPQVTVSRYELRV